MAELREKANEIRRKLEVLCEEGRGIIVADRPELLLALLDAYEITRDEAMLQEVLDVVSGNLTRLEVSAESVKLLAYCYYYVEEEECVIKAEEILKKLKKRGLGNEKIAEIEKIWEELI